MTQEKTPEQKYADELAVYTDSRSTIVEVISANKHRYLNKSQATYTERDYVKNVVKPAFESRISSILDGVETFEVACRVYNLVKGPGSTQGKKAILKAAALAKTFDDAISLYCKVRAGEPGVTALKRAAEFAETEDELWKLAVHSQKCRQDEIWRSAVLKLANKLNSGTPTP